ALVVAAVAYAAEAWRGGSGRPTPLGSFLVQAGAVLAAALSARRLAPVAFGGPAAEMVLTASAFWLAWQVLELPIGWASGRAQGRARPGRAEGLLRTYLICLSGVTLAILWGSGPVGFSAGLLSLVFLNRAVASS